jgi:CRP/FNR family transcriptional regulator, dissimilatory nitrate respiration regulator
MALGLRRSVGAGAIIFQQEAIAESCFLLESGEITLRRISRSGAEVELARIGEGEWFGEIILFAARVFPAQAVAARACSLLEFRRSAILSSSDPEVSSFFLSLLARKCLSLNRRIEELTIMDARERLARFVIRLCPGHEEGCDGGRSACSFPLPKKKREIAAELGMAPETLSRTLRQMEEEGYIKVKGSRLEVPSCAKLRRLIEGE